jgi:hypothetical protein
MMIRPFCVSCLNAFDYAYWFSLPANFRDWIWQRGLEDGVAIVENEWMLLCMVLDCISLKSIQSVMRMCWHGTSHNCEVVQSTLL